MLDDIAHVFKKGNKIRIAISNTYWPLIWPSPEIAIISLNLNNCRFYLPTRNVLIE